MTQNYTEAAATIAKLLQFSSSDMSLAACSLGADDAAVPETISFNRFPLIPIGKPMSGLELSKAI